MSSSQKRGLSVLVVSGTQDHAMIQQAFAFGAMGVVTKPLNPDRILQTFEQIGIVSKPDDGERPADAAEESSAKRCVIVDSDPGTRGMLKTLLAREAVEVVAEAEDGMQGLCSIEEHKPDLAGRRYAGTRWPQRVALSARRPSGPARDHGDCSCRGHDRQGGLVAACCRLSAETVHSAKVLAAVRKALGTP